MRNSKIKTLDIKTDKWVIDYPTSLGETISFDFTYLPNAWFKKLQKQITIECFTLDKPSVETLNRYNYSLKHFFNFIKQYEIDLDKYEDLTHQHTQMFLFYLKQQDMANSTRSTAISALKWIVLYGQIFEYEGFPKRQIFDGEEYQSIKTEDVLKTKYIPDDVIKQIELALQKEEDLIIKSLIEIGIDTGIRLSEALELSEGCITEDFTGKPVLHVISSKNNTERFIPVSRRVKKAVKTLEEQTMKGRKAIGLDNLTVYWMPQAKRFDKMTQPNFRYRLKGFLKKHKIINSEGNLYPLTYHAFRHTLGTDMLNRGMSIFEIRDYLGHESLHSTAGYAKFKNQTVQKEYSKLGFIGMIVEEISEESMGKGKELDKDTLKAASLPDGACKKPIDNQGNICARFNMCIICPKFITTPAHLPVHKNHLERLRADREFYMATEYIGSQNHLETIEHALETIIDRLEVIESGS
ncbi:MULTISPECIES: tyrosine-type recombinase/integrase [Bacillaceae]|uniref:Integrase n=1 Tax=Oceanobacillus caeni TaxID=405946 RepID=A0ABR5MGN4_9BACI|nr:MULTISPECIES: tyrosine-type recombinase/integrase [Bacillaceae]KPH71793.1 integrase [Oceanobacillus caeni]